jgi:hypothetical protein
MTAAGQMLSFVDGRRNLEDLTENTIAGRSAADAKQGKLS